MRIERDIKEKHSITGNQIKLILSVLPAEYEYRWDAEKVTPAGTIHTIIDRPTRKDHKNGHFGAWIDGVFGPVYAWFFEWEPYYPPMRRTEMKRTTFPTMIRTTMKRTTCKRTR
jgi:hypothetical protein